MNKPEIVGLLSSGKYNKMYDICKRVHSVDGISPTLNTCAGGGTIVKIMIIRR